MKSVPNHVRLPCRDGSTETRQHRQPGMNPIYIPATRPTIEIKYNRNEHQKKNRMDVLLRIENLAAEHEKSESIKQKASN